MWYSVTLSVCTLLCSRMHVAGCVECDMRGMVYVCVETGRELPC